VQAITITKTQGTKTRGEPTAIGIADMRHIRYTNKSMPFK